jgi:TatA/E family protein of Tat protein translocase
MGFRLPEMIVIAVVALLVFGPKRLPDMAASIGRSINAFKKGLDEFTHDKTNTVDELTMELRRQELEALEREIAFKKRVSHLYDMSAATTPPEQEKATVVESNTVVSEPKTVEDKYNDLNAVPTARETISTEL